ncbi:MAG: hypothetical protein CMH53_09950 [Myxococcales bacterium]|nr:hypothetical protein [Myxococcales bacterium]
MRTPPGIQARPRPIAGQPPLIPGAGGLPTNPSGRAQPSTAANAGNAIQLPVVVLPPDYPKATWDKRVARLDLPYQLRLRVLPPCPEGNDEQEPNDVATKAKKLKVGTETLLRICKGDTDWFELEQKQAQDLQVMARYDFAHGQLEMEAFDEQGSTSLAKAQTRAPRLPGTNKILDNDTPAARLGRTAITGLGLKGDKDKKVVKLRISGPKNAENFYILRVQEPPPPSSKNQKPKPQNKDNKDKKKNKKKNKQKDDKDKKKNKQKKNKPKPPKRSKDQQRQRRAMKRNDVNPKNLEAQEALRRSPFRNTRPAKDW